MFGNLCNLFFFWSQITCVFTHTGDGIISLDDFRTSMKDYLSRKPQIAAAMEEDLHHRAASPVYEHAADTSDMISFDASADTSQAHENLKV